MPYNHHKTIYCKKKNPYVHLLLFFLLTLVIGFIGSEIMGGVLVAKSNKELFAEQLWMEKMGYIAVPGTGHRSEILSIKTYLIGGLFFALSIGLAYAFFWGLLIIVFKSWPKILGVIMFSILAFIFCLYFSQPGWIKLWVFGLFLLIVPFLLILLSLLKGPQKVTKVGLFKGMPYIAALLGALSIIYIFFTPTLNSNDFIRIRDNLLGRSKWGTKVSSFYYHYTLYPARAIKNFNQKLQNTIRIDLDGFSEEEFRDIKSTFALRDFYIGPDAPSRAVIKKDKDLMKINLICVSPNLKLEEKVDGFIRNPAPIIKQFTDRTDSAAFLRKCISISLFNIWPVMGICFIYSLLLFFCSIIFRTTSPTRDSLLAFFVILFIIIGARNILRSDNKAMRIEHLLTDIWADKYKTKMNALIAISAAIEKKKIKQGEFSEIFLNMLKDPDPIIRRWGIDFLTKTKEKRAIQQLILLLKDPDRSVAYYAARSLGKLKAQEAKEPLVDIIKGSKGWYFKTTAYISLKNLGWRQ